jgi:hypothetical protein
MAKKNRKSEIKVVGESPIDVEAAQSGAWDAAVASIVAEAPAVEVKAKPKAKGGRTPRAKPVLVSGTGTWRDGMTQAKVQEWETWAFGFVFRAREKGVVPAEFDGHDSILIEMCCAYWRQHGKGISEAKLMKAVPTFTK